MMDLRAKLGGLLALLSVAAAHAQAPAVPVPLPDACIGRTDVLGLSRIVEIDTTGGPRFGHGQYKEIDFLEDGEVVLTFDDGPIRRYTLPILDALDAQCTRATFFAVGRMAVADPETLKETAERGHTIASHTWSHKKLTTVSQAQAIQEIELGLSAVSRALGAPVAPFFRFPYLRDTTGTLAHLSSRNQAVFSIDVDSRDFKTRNPGAVMRTVLAQLNTTRKGIILFHDIQPSTAGALASLLAELKARGFKVVHLVAKGQAETLPQYDAMADKALARSGLVLSTNPLANRAVNWPAAPDSGAEWTPSASEGDSLPWQVKTPASSDAARPPAARPAKRPAAQSEDDDPWQLRSFGR